MHNRSILFGAAATLTAILTGCAGNQEPHVPLLAELSEDADRHLDLVDRAAELTGAADYDLADAGEAIDMGGVSGGFLMAIDSEAIQAVDDTGAEGSPIPTYGNVWTATALAALADIGATAVVGPPAVAIAVTTDGAITQHSENVWVATNTLTAADGSSVTGTFVVAWVGVGWLAEMRLSTSDGTYDDDLWFNGFLSVGGAVGWWDLYDGTQLVGVVEWIADGQGNAQSGIAAVSGPDAGDVLSYWTFDDGEQGVFFHDEGLSEDAWVIVSPDLSGEVRAYNYNAGEPACWDVTLADAECPL